MDNARIHKSLMIKEFMALKSKIKFIFTAAYSPEINFIENIFNRIKRNFNKEKFETNK